MALDAFFLDAVNSTTGTLTNITTTETISIGDLQNGGIGSSGAGGGGGGDQEEIQEVEAVGGKMISDQWRKILEIVFFVVLSGGISVLGCVGNVINMMVFWRQVIVYKSIMLNMMVFWRQVIVYNSINLNMMVFWGQVIVYKSINLNTI
ncbi:hypothetical protein ElyMa_006644500 [Elysia marginata]|uniref:G-protein coupled receptors family 1 profile domain-containing protein n=1 Tax=Elysia marginata TaxID=1093978 RepID=A0AAV4IJU5_9GAST|nr:hypothetical protein ElyMa_006644500 [Elysia marginata]